MPSPRNIVLAVLIVAIALGVVYMLDPTFGGLLGRKHEGFNNVMNSTGAASMLGEPAGAFHNSGAADAHAVNAARHNESDNDETVSPMTPGAGAMGNGAALAEGFESLNPSPMPFAGAEKPANCYPKNQLAPTELLPNDPNSKWAQVNPMGAGDIAGKNFLNSGAQIGVNTIGQSNRNASWDLRAAPANPQLNVSPWMQSTIEPDLVRRPLE